MSTNPLSRRYLKLVKRFPLRPLRSREDHAAAVSILTELGIKDFDMSEDERDYFEVLSKLIREYEQPLWARHTASSPQEILLFMMEQHGLAQKDLVPLVGYKSNLSAFLAGKRNLSDDAAVKLGKRFNIDPNLLRPRLSA